MRKYLLSKDGNFYLANLHCHTTVSDGKRTPEEVKALYKSRGYSIVAFTDHDVMIDHSELDDESFGYVRITVIDKTGKRADTNAYFTDELFYNE